MKALGGLCWPCRAGSLWVIMVAAEEAAAPAESLEQSEATAEITEEPATETPIAATVEEDTEGAN